MNQYWKSLRVQKLKISGPEWAKPKMFEMKALPLKGVSMKDLDSALKAHRIFLDLAVSNRRFLKSKRDYSRVHGVLGVDRIYLYHLCNAYRFGRKERGELFQELIRSSLDLAPTDFWELVHMIWQSDHGKNTFAAHVLNHLIRARAFSGRKSHRIPRFGKEIISRMNAIGYQIEIGVTSWGGFFQTVIPSR